MTLGEQIKQKREEKNLTQEALAEQLNVSRQAVSKWESGLSTPHGSHRAALCRLLGLDIPDPEPPKSLRGLCAAGWAASALLLLALLGTLMLPREPSSDPSGSGALPQGDAFSLAGSPEPVLESIRFYDASQREVNSEALWYNAARMDSILIDWANGSPDQIKVFYTPSGSETLEQTQLLLTKAVLDGDSSALLSADPLHREDLHGHLYFELSFGDTVVTSELYNVFFDPQA